MENKTNPGPGLPPSRDSRSERPVPIGHPWDNSNWPSDSYANAEHKPKNK